MGAQGAVESHVSSSGPSLSQQPHRTAHTQRTSSRYVLRLRVSVVSRLEIACRNLRSRSFHRQHLDSGRTRPDGQRAVSSLLSLLCVRSGVWPVRRRGAEGERASRRDASLAAPCCRARVAAYAGGYIIYSTSRPPRRGGDDHLQEKGSGLTLSANTADELDD